MRPIGRLAALAVIAAAVLAPTAAASEQPPLTWGIVPSGPDGPGDRAAFEYTLDPGAAISDVVAVSNYTEQPLTLDLYASDAVRNTQGGFDLLPAADEPVDVGSWVDLGEPVVTIPARSRVDVPFTITVPANATPGDHAGGIVAGLTTQAAGGAGGQVAVDRRVGARIYLRVTGTLQPELTVDGVAVAFDGLPLGQPGTVRVEYTVRNDGNVRLAGRPAVRVTGPFGVGERTWTGDLLPELLPGDSVTGSATVTGVWQLGPLDVDIEIAPETSGTQVLDPAPPPGTSSTRLWVVPWLTLAALAVLVAALLWRRRRRRRRDRTRPA
ncbi:WxL protein peptidoglycan domain-containing protein [Jiangella rhizosphaerae]|uniref:DUF916 domain-containing protein n=1 Tax=Jiangella rhizosphaerae TaxID=2293569 RepID=A0A418KRQ4_9ACTN|nr:DUF916 domain-containing protein [Jiangella rhizosphaerae]RIQ25894.1 DUF916 domain-containing protein [Jiangella rhizosphaerae]